MPKNKVQNAPAEEDKHFTDEHTDKRIHEHLSNEDDHISEEDIRSVKTDVDNPGEVIPVNNTDEPELNDEEKEVVQDNTDPEIDTTWNILES